MILFKAAGAAKMALRLERTLVKNDFVNLTPILFG
jgi:hypothetical protein